MNVIALAEQFWKEGYLVLENFFNDSLMDAMNESIVDHFGIEPEYWHNDEFIRKSKTEIVPWFPQNDGVDVFQQCDGDEQLVSLTQAILGDDWQNLYCMVMFSKAGTTGQAWHQDCPTEDAQKHNINRLVYTADIRPEIGGQVVVVPGSHRLGEIPVGDPLGHFDNEVVLTPKKGTLVLLHGHTFHRVLPVLNHFRTSTNFRAIPATAQLDVTDICVYRNMKYSFSLNAVVEQRDLDMV